MTSTSASIFDMSTPDLFEPTFSRKSVLSTARISVPTACLHAASVYDEVRASMKDKLYTPYVPNFLLKNFVTVHPSTAVGVRACCDEIDGILSTTMSTITTYVVDYQQPITAAQFLVKTHCGKDENCAPPVSRINIYRNRNEEKPLIVEVEQLVGASDYSGRIEREYNMELFGYLQARMVDGSPMPIVIGRAMQYYKYGSAPAACVEEEEEDDGFCAYTGETACERDQTVASIDEFVAEYDAAVEQQDA